jgi:hypothetical protein
VTVGTVSTALNVLNFTLTRIRTRPWPLDAFESGRPLGAAQQLPDSCDFPTLAGDLTGGGGQLLVSFQEQAEALLYRWVCTRQILWRITKHGVIIFPSARNEAPLKFKLTNS